jgi:hypothetical protein
VPYTVVQAPGGDLAHLEPEPVIAAAAALLAAATAAAS